MKFIIHSFNFSKQWGGVLVLHKLGQILSDIGYEVYLIANNTIDNSKAKLISEEYAKTIANDDKTITIYPEVITGNPLNAKKVVRWILYHPGINGGDKIYSNDELIFTYSDYFTANTIYEGSPKLFIFDSHKDFFKNYNNIRNNLTCSLVKKGSNKNLNILTNTHIIDQFLNGPEINNNLLKIFNQYSTFISLDHATYHSTQAALCGCISIVIPEEGVNKEQWQESLPLMKYGVAYGLDDIQWAIETQPLVYKHLTDLEEVSKNTINNFLKIIKDNV